MSASPSRTPAEPVLAFDRVSAGAPTPEQTGLREAAFAGGKPSSRVLDHVREWERPSDHAPVIADFQVP